MKINMKLFLLKVYLKYTVNYSKKKINKKLIRINLNHL